MDSVIIEKVKAFSEEHMELLKWRFDRWDESEKLPNDSIGLDGGQRHNQERKDAAEYRRKLKELEVKLGITADEFVSLKELAGV